VPLRPVWPDAPRYGPDEPFPPYRYVPGTDLHPHPVRDAAGHSHGVESAPRPDDFRRGVDLYHAGFMWEAHEAWEGLWKQSDDPVRRDFLQGLIQLAAAQIKAHVGNTRGAAILRARARERLARVAETHERYEGLELAPVLEGIDAARAPRLELQLPQKRRSAEGR
jgi:hypothetical protein